MSTQVLMTKKGHRLEFKRLPHGIFFNCFGFGIVHHEDGPKKGEIILASMQIWPPCSINQISMALKAWLSVYNDNELVDGVDFVVDQAFSEMSIETKESGRPKSAN